MKNKEINFISNEEYVDLLNNRVYGNYIFKLFEKVYRKKITEYENTLLIEDRLLYEEVRELIDEEFYSKFKATFTEYLRNNFEINNEINFINSLTGREIKKIKSFAKYDAIPYSLLMLTIFTMLNSDNPKLKKTNEELTKIKFNLSKKNTLPPNSEKLKAYLKVIDHFLANKKSTVNNSCSKIYDSYPNPLSLSTEKHYFYNTFNSWTEKKINQDKFPIIKTFLEEKSKRSKFKKEY